MGARHGRDYVAALKKNSPSVYLHGRRITDVTEEPLFREPIRAIAEQYDLQWEEAHHAVMTYPSPSSGKPVSTAFQIPRTREELTRKREHFKRRTDHNFGFMGRAPDFMNQFVTGLHLMAARFARAGAWFGENVTNYYEHVREGDLFLTHMLINPQVDRSRTSAQQEEPFVHLGRVGQTAEGIVVRGAKMLGTLAPLTEEVLIMPFGQVPAGDDAYALGFAIPTSTPGLKLICRETVAPLPRNKFDHPLSSRFEEMDCIAIFEDVVIPWSRLFVDGGPGSAEHVNTLGAEFNSLLTLQMSARMLSQMEFLCGLATRLAESVGIQGFLHVQEKLGEMLTQLDVGRAVFFGSEALAQPLANGVWVPSNPGLRAFHLQSGKIYSRYVEIIQTLAAGGFFYAPTEADLNNPELRPALDKYLRGAPGVSAKERIALFKLAWDATGEGFGQRMAQYVRYYSGDPIRLLAGYYTQYDKAPLFALVERALAHR